MGRYIKTIKGRRYWYEQTPDYRGGKRTPITRYIGPVDGAARKKAADEKYREVLRDNVYKYGSSRPGARYADEARARAQYARDMGWTKPDEPHSTHEEQYRQFVSDFWFKIDSNQASDFEKRHREYDLTHRSPQSRAKEHFHNLRSEIQKEDARIDLENASQPAQNPPGRTEEAPAKNFTVDDEIEARQAKFEETLDEVNAMRDDEPLDDAPPADGPMAEPDGKETSFTDTDAPSADDGANDKAPQGQ
jgi:hypothetical protein